MITTTTMIKLGRVKGNKMVNMQLTNRKLIERGTRMIVEELNIQREAAKILLLQYGSVKKALESYRKPAASLSNK
jgi:N-acetylmuramic acid 6-phosphate etherase